jgi:hypothetical protein
MHDGQPQSGVSKVNPYVLTLLLSLTFFALTFLLRNSLEDFRQPFTLVFIGTALLVLFARRFEAFILIILITTATVFELLEFPTIF